LSSSDADKAEHYAPADPNNGAQDVCQVEPGF